MPDKNKKPKRSKEEARAARLFKHFKALKRGSQREFVKTYDCESCTFSTWPHMHGFYKMTTTDGDWKFLAKRHKMSVREVKDTISEFRNWDREAAVERYEAAVANAKPQEEFDDFHDA